jgi:hypothetical protein
MVILQWYGTVERDFWMPNHVTSFEPSSASILILSNHRIFLWCRDRNLLYIIIVSFQFRVMLHENESDRRCVASRPWHCFVPQVQTRETTLCSAARNCAIDRYHSRLFIVVEVKYGEIPLFYTDRQVVVLFLSVFFRFRVTLIQNYVVRLY